MGLVITIVTLLIAPLITTPSRAVRCQVLPALASLYGAEAAFSDLCQISPKLLKGFRRVHVCLAPDEEL